MNKKERRALVIWYLLLIAWAYIFFVENHLTPLPYGAP